jgi:hypothetical protein
MWKIFSVPCGSALYKFHCITIDGRPFFFNYFLTFTVFFWREVESVVYSSSVQFLSSLIPAGTHGHIKLSLFWGSPNLEGLASVLPSPRNTVSQLYPKALGLQDNPCWLIETPPTQSKSKSKSHYDRQSVGQAVLVSGAHLGPATNFSFSLRFSFRQVLFVIL